MPAPDQVLGDPDHGVRHAVDVGREGLRDDRDSHGLKVLPAQVRRAKAG
ncbi:MAG TPA: hypothetical protein VHN18_06025 [Micromonosporaceae bacterium]|nr:hypothetical protein [Micromonosporaceae bacterium]